ncbi:MAG: ammonium transporter [Methanospirillaceae archaeon]|nr:ammonium transporter [Methanospirillaceae archaeon]
MDTSTISLVDTGFLLICTAFVILMTFGVAFFYGGLVRRKNIISMLMLSFISFALVTLQWTFFGYSLAFGPDFMGIIGGLENCGLLGVFADQSTRNLLIPDMVFMVFQLAFAAITLAIVTSALAERVKLSSFIIFGLLWTTLVYDPIAHWVWGNGWAATMGILDFAGGTVVHITAGFSALALVFVIRNRHGFTQYSMNPSNIPLTLIGGALLWFGWFGFNAGSAYAINEIAVNAFVVTNISAAAGSLSWMTASWIYGKPGSLSMISGTIAGLGAITPAAGFVGPIAAFCIGTLAGLICYYALMFRLKQGWDESLDAWAIHGVGGFFGTLCLGIFASVTIGGVAGIIEGSTTQFGLQFLGAGIITLYAIIATYGIAFFVDILFGLRVSEDEEYVGLDLSQHGETTDM